MFKRATILMVGVVIASLAFVATPANAAPYETIIRNWETGRCLDSDFAGAVYTLPCNGGTHQKWRAYYLGSSCINCPGVWHKWQNVATGRYLDANPANGAVYTNGGTTGPDNLYQIWWPIPTDTSGSWAKINVRHYQNINSCLDSNYIGQVYMYGCNGGGFQLWRADGNL